MSVDKNNPTELNKTQKATLTSVVKALGGKKAAKTASSTDLKAAVLVVTGKSVPGWLSKNTAVKVSRGVYNVAALLDLPVTKNMASKVSTPRKPRVKKALELVETPLIFTDTTENTDQVLVTSSATA